LASVISLDEAARRTGLTKRQIGDRIAKRELTIERDPVTGEKGIYPHTLRGVNGYQPPELAPRPKPPSPPPPEPEPWAPSAAELAALIRLDQTGRDAAMAGLIRQHSDARAYFRDNPLPPVYRPPEPPPPPEEKPAPPPPPPSWETQWEPPEPPKPPPPTRPVSFQWLLMDVLVNVLLALRNSAGRLLTRARRSYLRLAVIGGLLLAGWLWLQSPAPRPWQPAPVIVSRPAPQIVRPIKHHHAPPATHHPARPGAPSPSPYPLPSLRSPGSGRPDLQAPR
jgi:hypothetical protein